MQSWKPTQTSEQSFLLLPLSPSFQSVAQQPGTLRSICLPLGDELPSASGKGNTKKQSLAMSESTLTDMGWHETTVGEKHSAWH